MALDLDGTNDAITAPSASINNDKGALVAWFSPDFQINGNTTNRILFDADTSLHRLYATNSAAVDMQMSVDGRYINFETGDISVGNYHLFVMVYNKTGNVLKLYIDGSEITGNSPGGTWGSSSLGTDFHVAQKYDGTLRFDGGVAEVATYSDVLSDADILSMSKGISPLLIRPEILTSYWKNIRDEVTPAFGEHDITLVGSPTIEAHPPIIYPAPVFSGFGAAAVAAGRLSRSHNLNGLSGMGQQTFNPME